MESKYRTLWNPDTRRALIEFRLRITAVNDYLNKWGIERKDAHAPELWELLDDVENILDSEGVTL